MKNLKKYLILFSLLTLIFNGCDKPSPTELVKEEEEELKVEVLAKDTEDEYYTADSSGVVEDLRKHVNVITVSGLKTTIRGNTLNTAYAQAIFFDKTIPIRRRNGIILGYKTRILGDVKFNNVQARRIPYGIRFREDNLTQEVNLGFRHVLNTFLPAQQFNYGFNSSVAFQLDLAPILGGSSISFDIPTPSEITGIVRFEGDRKNNSLNANLKWDAGHYSDFEIIIGAINSNSGKNFPLFRIKTDDDGELIIPSSLLNRIPLRFNSLVISFVRKLESKYQNSNGELYILSQSIHNLVLDIP